MTTHTLLVAVGVLINTHGKVLLGQRWQKNNYFGKWEFPGGKVEATENAEQALIREWKEELGILIQQYDYLCDFSYTYPEKNVHLWVYRIQNYQGKLCAKENQKLQWIKPAQIMHLDTLPTCDKILGLLKQKAHY